MFHSFVCCSRIDELSLGHVPQLDILLHDRRAESRYCSTGWYLASGSPARVQVMLHSLVPCFRIAELSLGNAPQLGILLQDRRAEFR